jgi:hypothetical protein
MTGRGFLSGLNSVLKQTGLASNLASRIPYIGKIAGPLTAAFGYGRKKKWYVLLNLVAVFFHLYWEPQDWVDVEMVEEDSLMHVDEWVLVYTHRVMSRIIAD